MSAAKLLELLSHPVALGAMDSLSKGASPKGVLAGLAGDLFAAKVAEALGTEVVKAGGKADAKKAKADEADVIDAEYKVINVTPKKGAAK